jgi:uncharacterized protein with HEPN domain
MPSDAAATALRDMEHHIALATQFVAGLDYEAFRNDIRTVFAVTRCLKVISEASRRLPDEMKTRYPAIAWKNMAGAGNIYRHDYEDVAAKLVWDTVPGATKVPNVMKHSGAHQIHRPAVNGLNPSRRRENGQSAASANADAVSRPTNAPTRARGGTAIQRNVTCFMAPCHLHGRCSDAIRLSRS